MSSANKTNLNLPQDTTMRAVGAPNLSSPGTNMGVPSGKEVNARSCAIIEEVPAEYSDTGKNDSAQESDHGVVLPPTQAPTSSFKGEPTMAASKTSDTCEIATDSLFSNLIRKQLLHVTAEPRRSTCSNCPSPPPERSCEDQHSSPHQTATTPGPSTQDVVCGRGLFMYHHPGSVRFRQIVRNAAPYYEVADSRSLKAIVIKLVWDQIFECYGTGEEIRFLKFDGSAQRWIALSDAQVRDKIGHALRDSVLEMQRARNHGRDSASRSLESSQF